MKLQLFSLLAASIVLATGNLPASAAEAVEPPEGFTALFNGHDFTGWHGMPHFDPRKLAEKDEDERAAQIAAWTDDANQHWSVDGNELVNDGKGAYLTTDREYGDMEFFIEYKTVAKADSGIYLRSVPQVQIWDPTEEGKWKLGADKGSGGLWNNGAGAKGKDPLVLADKPFGEWNKFRIRQVGDRTTIWLNGQLVVDHAPMENYWDRDRPLFAKGPIQLQTHGGEIRWRNIFLREIPAEEANELLREQASSGFTPIFNGKDFAGWSGPLENFAVDEEGAIVCKPGRGGFLFTDEEYADFVVQLEFQLPSGGNNGLAIRYPGSGDPAYLGMCELQVLDSEHPKYADLDPRQFHGSAYGIAAAHRGYLRPTGEWNFQQVTVQGSTVRVELNGYTILDADLSKITEYLADSPHPGKDLTSGHFGLAGHNDPVKFRNLRIKHLPTAAAD